MTEPGNDPLTAIAEPAAPAPAAIEPEQPVIEPAEPAESAPALPEALPENAEAPGVNKTVEELKTQRAKRQSLDLENARLRGQIDAMQNKQPDQQPVKQTGPPIAPDLNQFDTVEEYEVAREKHIEDRAVYRVHQEIESRQQQEQTQKVARDYDTRVRQTITEIPDFEETLQNSTVQMPGELITATMESEIAPRIFYHLAKNPAEAGRISGMSKTAAIREIGKLEAQLVPKNTPSPAPRKVSQAPEPIIPGRGSGAVPKTLGEMTTQEYIDHRNAKEWGPTEPTR